MCVLDAVVREELVKSVSLFLPHFLVVSPHYWTLFRTESRPARLPSGGEERVETYFD